MNKTKKILDIVSAILAIVGFLYLFYKFSTDIDNIYQGLKTLSNSWWIIITELVLMLINIALETLRWIEIDKERSGRYSFYQNFKTITESIALSLITPLGIGEHIGKARGSNNAKSSVVASALGSFIQTSVIVLMGIIGSLLLSYNDIILIAVVDIFIIVAILILAIFVVYKAKTRLIIDIINEYSISKIAKIYLINIVRCIVFSYQMYLMQTLSISSFNTDIFYLILVYYMVITLTPSSGLADIGIRGTMAITFIGGTNNNWSGVAAVMIWIINKIIPSIFGFQSIIFSVIKSRRNHSDSGIANEPLGNL